LDTWTHQTNGLPVGNQAFSTLTSVTYGKGLFVAVGETYVARSRDGTNWTVTRSITKNSYEGPSGGITLQPNPATNNLTQIAFGNNQFVAIGNDFAQGWPSFVTSSDGTNWTSTQFVVPSTLTAIAFGNGIFVATVWNGSNSLDYYSFSGTNWNGPYLMASNKEAWSITYGNGVFAALTFTSQAVLSSSNAVEWTKTSTPTNTYYQNCIGFGNGQFVILGEYGDKAIYSSSNLVNWTQSTASANSVVHYDMDPNAVAFGNGSFLATCGGYIVESSAETPTSWSILQNSGNSNGPNYLLDGITYGNGMWVAVGQESIYDPPVILTSGSLTKLTNASSGTQLTLSSVVASAGHLLAVGGNGTIIQSVDEGGTWMPTAGSGLFTNLLNSITFTSNSDYIAVGSDGLITLSFDTTNWIRIPSGVTNTLTGIASGNGVDVAVGSGGVVLMSTNDTNWTPEPVLDTNGLSSIVYGNGQFEAVGSNGLVLLSTNGVSWTTNTPLLPLQSGSLHSVSYNNGQYSALDTNGDVLLSTNGLNWITLVTGPGGGSTNNPNGLVYYDDRLVLVGNNGSIQEADFPVAGTGTDTALNAAAYSGQMYVAVGNAGTIIKSADSSVWTMPTNYFGTPNDLYSVAYGNGQFVGVGENSWVVTSSDGDNWASTSSGVSSVSLYGVAFGNGVYVAVGDQGTIIRSIDGLNWTVDNSGTSDSFGAVTFGNGQFVVTGGASDSLTSIDGTNWTNGGAGLMGGAEGLCAGNGLYVAVTSYGVIFTSPDGLNWTPQATPNVQLFSVSYGGGSFVATAPAGFIYVSPNGTNWTQLQTDDGNLDLYGGTAGDSQFVLVGENGGAISAAYGSLGTSPSATVWNTVNSPARLGDTLTSVVFNGSTYVIVASTPESDLVSSNSTTWTLEGNGLENEAAGVTWGNGVFVTVDSYGNIYTSPDGQTWTQRAGTGLDLYAVAYGGGVYVATSDSGIVVTSTDSIHWSPHQTPLTDTLSGAVYANGQFVIVADDGSIATSPNGTSWTQQSTPSGELFGVTYGDNQYVAVGSYGVILTSPDGTNWTLQTNSPVTENALYSVAWGNNEFMAVGQNGWTVSSPDGSNWISSSSATINDLYSIIYARGSFLAVGDDATILETPLPTAPQLTASVALDGQLQVTVTGAAGASYSIEVSADLIHWTQLTGVTLRANNTGQFLDEAILVKNPSQRFYRAVPMP
jgi:photosystem II stability/assembly factor-like uncharacterized protein